MKAQGIEQVAEPFPESIELEYHDEVWQQPIDYENIPFRCRKCHEYNHLYRQCPQNREEGLVKSKEEQLKEKEKAEEADRDFQQVTKKKKTGKEGFKIQTQEKPPNIERQNKFKILQEQSEDYEIDLEEEEDPGNMPMEIVKEEKGKETERGRKEEEEVAGRTEELTNQTQMVESG